MRKIFLSQPALGTEFEDPFAKSRLRLLGLAHSEHALKRERYVLSDY